jgi:hypothetical protein
MVSTVFDSALRTTSTSATHSSKAELRCPMRRLAADSCREVAKFQQRSLRWFGLVTDEP